MIDTGSALGSFHLTLSADFIFAWHPPYWTEHLISLGCQSLGSELHFLPDGDGQLPPGQASVSD